MAIILEDPRASFGRGLNVAAGALSSALQRQTQKRDIELEKEKEIERNKQYGSVLQSTLANLGPNPSPLDFMTALASTQEKGVPLDYATRYGTLYSTLEKAQKQPFGPEQQNALSGLFQKFGQSPEEASRNAELWGNLTTGGQTEFAKYLLDSIVRGTAPTLSGSMSPKLVSDTSTTVDNVEEFQWPEVNIFKKLTPKEESSFRRDLLKINNEELKEIRETINTKDRQLTRYRTLETLNNSDKLPSGLSRLNINWATGDIRFPALANPETQLFVKTINDFTTEAKDTYGARVTNFELGAFMKRLPTLANTTEGRRLILAQMKNMGEIDRLREDALKRVYDYYGTQEIDRSTAEKIADKLMAPDVKRLREETDKIIDTQNIFEAKNYAPEGKIAARDPSGKIVYIWRDQADKAQKKGYEPL